MKKETNRPAAEIRLGTIIASIWKNETENGARYNVSFGRLYKDGKQWKRAESFGKDDLLVLAKVADEAHTQIHHLFQDSGKDSDE
jgi:hypothetical protein